MKYILVFIFTILITGCSNDLRKVSKEGIEPGKYQMMGYRVKDLSYHDTIANYLKDGSNLIINKDSLFISNKSLGKLLFNGNSFKCKIKSDSLFLNKSKNIYSYKISKSDPNSFEIEINNKYFDKVFFIRSKAERKEIITKVSISY